MYAQVSGNGSLQIFKIWSDIVWSITKVIAVPLRVRVWINDPYWTQTFDGDTMSSLVAYSDEAINEIKRYQKSARGYLNTSGDILHSVNVDTVNYVCVNLSSPPVRRV